MKTLTYKLDVETYALCEKVAKAAGKTVEEWIAFLIAERVGHTFFCRRR